MKEKERLAKEESLRNREMLHKRVESDKLVGQNRFKSLSTTWEIPAI